MKYLCVLIFIFIFPACDDKHSTLTINIDFPGGNIILDSVKHDTVYIRPDNRDSDKPWFYWYFEASSMQTQKVTFKFNQENVMTTFGPAVSADGGLSWYWLFDTPQDLGYFDYEFDDKKRSARFCTAMPYLQNNFDTFCRNYKDNNRFQKGDLTQTRIGRTIEKVIISPSTAEIKAKVLITARHHASEMMANYILEGIIDEVMHGERLETIQQHVEFLVIPFMDKDGVEQGDQGKHRKPRDHNRDYNDVSIYASTKALRKEIPAWTGGLPLDALDIHNPWIKYDNNEITYLVGSAIPRIDREQQKFGYLLDSIQQGLLTFNKDHFMPFGKEWNTDKNYSLGWSFDQWAGQLDGVLMSSTLETPYATNEGQQVAPESARSFGRDIARALNIYLTTHEL